MPLIQILAAAAGAGEPTLRPGLDADQVSPGPWGFFFTFGLAALVVFLIWDMSRRIRRVRYRAQLEERGGAGTPETAPEAAQPADMANPDSGQYGGSNTSGRGDQHRGGPGGPDTGN